MLVYALSCDAAFLLLHAPMLWMLLGQHDLRALSSPQVMANQLRHSPPHLRQLLLLLSLRHMLVYLVNCDAAFLLLHALLLWLLAVPHNLRALPSPHRQVMANQLWHYP
jgi:hypothetical protein